MAAGGLIGAGLGFFAGDAIKNSDMGKAVTDSVKGWAETAYESIFGNGEVKPVKQDQQGNRMQSKASQQEKSGQTVVNVNTQNNNNNTAVNGGGAHQPPISATDDLDGVRRYAYSGNFIGTD